MTSREVPFDNRPLIGESLPHKGEALQAKMLTSDLAPRIAVNVAQLPGRDAGAKAADLARKHGISEATLYNWKAKYGGMDVSDAKRLRSLEEENRKLKKLLAESILDQAALKELLTKKW
jgi:putative transposase